MRLHPTVHTSIQMSFQIHQVDWATHREALHSVRYEVFVIGQNVPAEEEVDSMDPNCNHFLATDSDSNPIGTARVLADGHIGRVAVLEPWRGKGVGRALMLASLDCVSKLGLTTALLDSQLTAAAFYEKLGFEQVGEEFMECGIPHIAMQKRLQ